MSTIEGDDKLLVIKALKTARLHEGNTQLLSQWARLIQKLEAEPTFPSHGDNFTTIMRLDCVGDARTQMRNKTPPFHVL